MNYDVDKAVCEFESYLDYVLSEYPSGQDAWETILWGLRDQQSTLRNHGFVPCDNAECGCHSWHHRYGLAERYRELQDVLREAGVLNSATGSRPIDGVRKLIEQRDQAMADAERWRAYAKEFPMSNGVMERYVDKRIAGTDQGEDAK